MHIIFVNYVYSADLPTAKDLLNAYFQLTGWVDGLTLAGVRVTVFQRFHQDEILSVHGAEYHFISDNLGPAIYSHHMPLKLHRNVCKYIRDLADENGTILHVNGLLFPTQVLHLRLSVPKQCCIIMQHHAERPKKGVGNILQRICLKPVDGFMFSTREHAKKWIKAGIIRPGHVIGEVMETSSNLHFEDREIARNRTGLSGNPFLLWTGNLNQNKDPMTILLGLKMILEIVPDARLYMAYRYADLLAEVENYINSSEQLKKTVTLLGPIPYSEIGSFYNSADFFVQGSHRESGGIAVSDALACGVIPVVTDIPSFRVLLNNGRVGALWHAGDPASFTKALLSLINDPIDQLSRAAREHFVDNFSFERLGRQAMHFYNTVVTNRSRIIR